MKLLGKFFVFSLAISNAHAVTTFASSSVDAAAYWSFQEASNGTTWDGNVTATKGFTGTPTVAFAGNSVLATGNSNGSDFTYDGTSYAGGGQNRTAGWQVGTQTAWQNDERFTLALVSTGFENLSLNFIARTAASPTPHSQAPSSGTFEYSLNGGANWLAIATTASWTANASHQEVELDFSAATGLNDQGSLLIRFNLDDYTGAAPTVDTIRNVRIDNILLTATAIPEPTSFALILSALLPLALRRSR